MTAVILDRRRVLAGSGALILSFSLTEAFAQTQNPAAAPSPPNLPGSLKVAPFLDSWIRIDADGSITVFTGKAELGQGVGRGERLAGPVRLRPRVDRDQYGILPVGVEVGRLVEQAE